MPITFGILSRFFLKVFDISIIMKIESLRKLISSNRNPLSELFNLYDAFQGIEIEFTPRKDCCYLGFT